MFYKKRYLLFTVISFMLFFCWMNDCYADEKKYEFDYDQTLLIGLCTSGSGCEVTCKKSGKTYKTAALTPPYGYCDEYNDVSKFKYDKSMDISSFKNVLANKKCGNSKTSCFDYVETTYCKNHTGDTICEDIKNSKGTADVKTNSNGDSTSTCKAGLIPYNKTDMLNSDDKLYVNLIKKSNSSTLTITSFDGNTDINFSGKDSITIKQTNIFYFYSVDSDFKAFSKEYKKKWESCPSITFCLLDGKPSGGYYKWYAELDGDCDSSKYFSGVYQETDGDGASSGLKLLDEEPTPGKDLISETEISILDCETLLGGANSELVNLLKDAITIVKIVVPIILIVLGSIDFVQAIFSQSEDGIKKAQSKFARRLIIAVVIFLIPTILYAILKVANDIWGNIDTTFCGLLGDKFKGGE